MSRKFSVYINIPGLGIGRDFLIPANMSICKAIELITKIVTDEYPGVHSHNAGISVLYQLSSGMILDPDCTLGMYSISDGEALIMI